MPSIVQRARAGARDRVHAKIDADVRPVVRWGLGHVMPRTALRVAARRGDLQGRLVGVGRDGDPFPVFEQLREHGRVYRGRFAFVTTSLPTVREVLTSNDFRTGFDPSQIRGPLGRAFLWATNTDALGPLEPPSLLVTEPPDHTRYRKLVTRVFSVRAVEKLRTRTEEIALELLDQLEAGGARDVVDIVPAYCTLLPVTVIAEILGVPISERERILGFGEAAAPSLDLGLSWKQFRRVESALAAFESWLRLAPGAAAPRAGRGPVQPAGRRARGRPRPGRPRAQGHRRARARRRLRDHGQPARQRHRPARPAPRPARPAARPTRRSGPTPSTRSCATTRPCC